MKKARNFMPLVIVLGLLNCCQDGKIEDELESLRTRLAEEKTNMERVRQTVTAINNGDFDALKDFMADDYAIYSPSGYSKPTSRDKLIESYKGARTSFSSFVWNIQDIIASGDKVVCRLMIHGATKEGAQGIPPAGKEFSFSMITIMRLEKGKIIEEWQEDDQLGFARQIGMELRPKEEKK